MTDDTLRAIMMGMCPTELEKQAMLISDRFTTYLKVKAAIRESVEKLRHKPGQMELEDLAPFAGDECEGHCGEEHAAGDAKGEGKAKGKGKTKAPAKRYGTW